MFDTSLGLLAQTANDAVTHRLLDKIEMVIPIVAIVCGCLIALGVTAIKTWGKVHAGKISSRLTTRLLQTGMPPEEVQAIVDYVLAD